MVVRLSALSTGRLCPQEIHVILISVKDLSRPQGNSATGMIKSLKNSNDTIHLLVLRDCNVVVNVMNKWI